MIKTFSFILIISFILSSCSVSPTSTETIPPVLSSLESTVTQAPTDLPTKMALPTATYTQAITSTFYPSTIITRTPSTAAECPLVVDNLLSPQFAQPELPVVSFNENIQRALDYLNEGGEPEALLSAIKSSGWLYHGEMNSQIKDITGDGIAEIIISPSETFVFGCHNEKYEILLDFNNEGKAVNSELNRVVAIDDMNLNGVPELVVATYGCGGAGAGMCLDGGIYEWDGTELMSILEISFSGRQISGEQPLMEVKNVNNEELLELTLTGGIISGGDYYYHYPWRQETDIYVWNGDQFVLQKIEYSAPQFRYQVVQDADRAALRGEYNQAIKLYQNAIYGNYDWFSAERKQYVRDTYDNVSNLTEPNPDPNEQPNLAAYSFFRIMLTYVLQGNLDEARTAYERIHKNFLTDSLGYDYVIITDAFWNEYQTNQDIEKACENVIQYALDHPAILKYLGSDYHNSFQDMAYGSTDICPFK